MVAGPAPKAKAGKWRSVVAALLALAALAGLGWKLRTASAERDRAVAALATASERYDAAQRESTTSIATLRSQLAASNQASLDRSDEFMRSLENFRLDSLRIDRAAARSDAIIAGMSSDDEDLRLCRTPQSVQDAMEKLK